jgi:hypothetical protein
MAAGVHRPQPRKRIPVVLTVGEVTRLLAVMTGEPGLLARLLYGTRTVQKLLGHADVSTIMLYTHVLELAAGGAASRWMTWSRSTSTSRSQDPLPLSSHQRQAAPGRVCEYAAAPVS